MTTLAIVRWRLWTFGADTGTFTQIALNAFAGFYDTSERGSHFHVHWSPILIVLYPFAAATHAGLSIQIVQLIAIGVAIFPCYAWLRGYAGPGLAAALATIVLFYPPLLAVAFDEFHEIAFYPALTFALLWALDRERWGIAAIVGALLLLVREEVLIVNAVFGLVLCAAAAWSKSVEPRGLLFFEPRSRPPTLAFGAAFAGASGALCVAYFTVIAPSLGGWTASHFYAYAFARGPVSVLAAIVREPFTVLAAIATLGRLTYLLEAFGPLLFLPLGSRWMLVALPALAVVLLSSDPSAWRMGSHYAGLWAPWLFVAMSDVVVRYARGRTLEVRGNVLVRWIAGVCALVLIFFDPLHPAHYLRAPYADRHDAALAFASIPASASVFTHDEWFAREAGTHPASEHVWSEPEFAILADDFPNPRGFAPFMHLQVARRCYAVERRFTGVVVYRRLAAATADVQCRIPR